jgi:hypothetical protein
MHYAGTPPGVERIEFQRYEQAAEEWARLLAHEVDLITFVPWTKEGWIRRIPSVRPVASLSKSLAEIQFVRPAAPFDNPRVRYALALAIDRAAIVQATFGGHASSAIGVVWPNDPGFEKDLPPYAYTPDEARRILVDAGATAASDGTLEWKGQPLAFHLDYLAGFSELEESALFLQKQLGDIGVVVELGARTIPEMEQQLVGGNAPATLLLFRHATSDLLSDREVRGLPPATPGSPVSDQRRLREQPPSIYLFWPERLDVIDKRFCGLPRLPDGPEPALDRVHLCARGEVE